MIYQMVATARDMGISLEEFMQLSDDEKAIQIVYSSMTSKIEQVNMEDARKKSKSKK